MFAMFNQFFAMFVALFSAGEKSAKALDNLATVGEKKSEVFLAEAEAELIQRRMQLEHDTTKLTKELKVTK